MKNSILAGLIVLLFNTVSGREPQNLIGTDFFPDVVAFINPHGDLIELPTRALNLAYGAECFTVCCQPLYEFGELVVYGTADSDIAGRGRQINKFYKEIIEKKPLTYERCNPLALLVRTLFCQNPGTNALSEFHITKPLQKKSMEWWADFVIRALCLYLPTAIKLEDDRASTADSFKKFDKEQSDPLSACKTNLYTKAPAMSDLLRRSIAWARENDLGEDFPLRVVMAGVYELSGGEPNYIKLFYQGLYRKIKELGGIAKWVPVDVEKFHAIGERIESFAPDLAGMETTSPSTRACVLLKQYNGPFSPLASIPVTYKGQVFTDCFETMLRCSMLILLLTPDGGFREGVVRPEIDTFLKTYPDMPSQALEAARNDWLVLMSNIPKALYCSEKGCELEVTFVNFLFMLNYTFDLRIADFGESFVPQSDREFNNCAFIEMVLSKVNMALAVKLGLLADTQILQVQKEEGDDEISDREGTDVNCDIETPYGTLEVLIQCYLHGEVNIEYDGVIEIDERGEFPFLERAILGTISHIYIGSNLALCRQGLTLDELEPMLTICSEHRGLIRMLYAVGANEYVTSAAEYFEWLQKAVMRGFWYEEALSAVQVGLVSVGEEEQRGAIKLLDVLFSKGRGFEEIKLLRASSFLPTLLAMQINHLLEKYKKVDD